MDVRDFFDLFDEACTTDGNLPTTEQLNAKIVVELYGNEYDIRTIEPPDVDGIVRIRLWE